MSFSSGKCKKTFEIRGGKLEVRVSLGDVFNRQVNTFLERDVMGHHEKIWLEQYQGPA